MSTPRIAKPHDMTEFLQAGAVTEDLPWYPEPVVVEEDPFYTDTMAAIETLLAAFPPEAK